MSSIVIIEEDDLMRGLLVEWLTAAGYAVLGQAPYAVAPGRSADVVIVDLYMPRQAGVNAVRCVQEAYPGTPLIAISAQFRAGRKNLKPLLKMSGKPELADELWPLLERKLDRALAKRTETRIPVVPVIDEAMRMAQEYRRGNTVIALTLQ